MKPKTEFKRWCSENGYMAKDISEKTGISLQAVFSYMAGRRYPCRKNLKLLEDAYGVDVRELFPL